MTIPHRYADVDDTQESCSLLCELGVKLVLEYMTTSYITAQNLSVKS